MTETYTETAAPIVAWPGGKRRLASHILPMLPEHRCYCEPFCGAAAIFFLKEPCKVEIINDINGELVNLYRIAQNHLEEFVRQFKWALVSREMFKWLQITRTETLTDVQRAARFFYLQQAAFGAKLVDQSFGSSASAPVRINLLRIEEILSAAHLRLARVTIEHLPWAECMARYDKPETLFFLDPPYWQTEGYGVPFEFEQYERLADMMASISGHAVLTVNDHADLRPMFKRFKQKRVEIRYTLGQGRRKPKASGELIIWNR